MFRPFAAAIIGMTAMHIACAAGIPAPPWAARHRGPTSNLEVVTYAAQVRPLLPEDVRMKLDAASNAAPAEIAALLYEARLEAMAGPARAQGAAPGNGYVMFMPGTNAARDVEAVLDTYRSQWPAFYGGSASGVFAAATDAAGMMRASALLEKLVERMGNRTDPLDGLAAYGQLFRMPGASMTVFWHANKLYWARDYARAEPLLAFLVQPSNKDGFSKGSAYYFLARIQRDAHRDPQQAFASYLRVQKHPACLVYTAYAYMEAAGLLRAMGQYVNALALLAVDVPCIDFPKLRASRHMIAADICLQIRDRTNLVRHLQAALATGHVDRQEVQYCLSRSTAGTSALWDALATNVWTDRDALRAIEAGVACPVPTPDDDLFADALMHQWPAVQDVPVAVATNRVLNNNVFEYRQRELSPEAVANSRISRR